MNLDPRPIATAADRYILSSGWRLFDDQGSRRTYTNGMLVITIYWQGGHEIDWWVFKYMGERRDHSPAGMTGDPSPALAVMRLEFTPGGDVRLSQLIATSPYDRGVEKELANAELEAVLEHAMARTLEAGLK